MDVGLRGECKTSGGPGPTEFLSSFQNVHFDELFFVNYSLFNLGRCTYVSECLCPSIIGLSWPLHFCAWQLNCLIGMKKID